MGTATLSQQYQVAIPRAVCESVGLEPGQKVQVIAYEGRIVLIPLRSAREMRGLLAELDTRVPRETDRVGSPGLLDDTERDQ
jgi:AbrB family looped-hinge helix DNA binding protein